ncbi:MAG: hypothetical protein RBS80_11875 [Thermoguttaceae bacterium]|jgi:hypothetical protein|nr:hypothetical protein [Thermoguttaceae bacterium]
MAVRIIGPSLLADDQRVCPGCGIATVFPAENAVVTLPGIHATQRLDFLDWLNKERSAAGLTRLSRDEAEAISLSAVDVVWEERLLLIRPDGSRMDAALAADDLLQRVVPKWQIRFLNTQDDRVWTALKQRGECWRTAPKPTSIADMQRLVIRSRKAIGHGAIYYYSRATGSHLLTCDEFAQLDALDDDALRDQFLEIVSYTHERNRLGHCEVVFFGAGSELLSDMQLDDLLSIPATQLRGCYRRVRNLFHCCVAPELCRNDPADTIWLTRVYRALTEPPETPEPEEVRLELSGEFHRHVEWLPGGRFEDGRLLWDSVFEHAPLGPAAPEYDTRVKDFVLNLFREWGDLEYVNIGRVVEPLARRPKIGARRGVYVAEIKRQTADREEVKIIRLQKWAVHDRLNERRDLLQAMRESDEYTEYVQDRWVGCRHLGMHLPECLITSRLVETCQNETLDYHDTRIWVDYFIRDYVRGIATDKIAPSRFADEEFAIRFACLLGQAAAVNMVVGRCDPSGRVLFDDGDEILVEDANHLPARLMVADHTGAFADYRSPVSTWAGAYAQPILRRAKNVDNASRFAVAYLDACTDAFIRVQEDYRRHRSAFDRLFEHRPRQQSGSFGNRWDGVLHRLHHSPADELKAALRRALDPAFCSPAVQTE